MSNLVITFLCLEKEQKNALRIRARQNGTSVSDEIRSAVDIYLNGITVEELMKFESASRTVEKDLKSIVATIDATNQYLDATFDEMDRLQTEKRNAVGI